MHTHFILPSCIQINYAKEILFKITSGRVDLKENKNDGVLALEQDSCINIITTIHSNSDSSILNVLEVAKDGDYIVVWDFNCLGINLNLFHDVIEQIEKRNIEVQILNPNFKFSFKDETFKNWYLGTSSLMTIPKKMEQINKNKLRNISEKMKIDPKDRKPRSTLLKRLTPEQKVNIRMDKRKGMHREDILIKHSISNFVYKKLTLDIKGVNRLLEYRKNLNETQAKKEKKLPVVLSKFFSETDDYIFVVLNKYLSTKRTQNTRKHYQYYLAKLYNYVEGLENRKGKLTQKKLLIDGKKINEFFDMMKKENFENNTIAHYYAVYKNWFTYLFSKGYIPENPILDSYKPVKSKDFCTTAHLEKNDLKRLFDLVYKDIEELEKNDADEQTLFAIKRDFVIFYLMATTGLRSGSVTGITKNDIIKNGKYHVRVKMKGGYNENVYLPPETLKVFNTFVKEYSEDLPMYFNVFRDSINEDYQVNTNKTIKYLKNVLKRLNINIVAKLHVFRVTFAVHCHQNGMSLIDIRDKLYHSDVSITSKYIKRVDEFAKVNLMPRIDIVNSERLLKRKSKNRAFEATCNG